MDLAAQSDVEKQLGRELTDTELDRLPGLLAKASVIVEGYLGVIYNDGDTIPGVVTVVVASMVARVFATDGTVTPGMASETQAAGPFSWQRTYGDGANALEPWMTKTDRTALQALGSGVVSVLLASERR